MMPANVDTMIGIPISFEEKTRYFRSIAHFTNRTCKFTVKNDTSKTKITQGVITSFPSNDSNLNMFLCQSPVWEEVGDTAITISINGYDFTKNFYSINMTDPIVVYKLVPPCGPVNGSTLVSLYGTGFIQSKDFVFKWGVQNLVSMSSANSLDNFQDPTLKVNSNFQTQIIKVRSPEAPYSLMTHGGLDYLAISKISFLPMDDLLTKFNTNSYIHTNLEYYYYKQPYVQSISPHGSIVTGGTRVLVVGAWFHNKPEYGAKPYCRFGKKIVEGEYLSTVRIACVAPEYPEANVKVPFDVSLNKYDFTDSDIYFTYYSDFTKAKFDRMEPSSGPDSGGTVIKLFGENITSLLDPEEFLCQFKPTSTNNNMLPKNVPAGFKDYGNSTAVICNTPGGWSSGTKASILITFDGQNYIDTNFDFYFYKVEGLRPASGPTTGGGSISVVGSGFQNSTKVKCRLGDIELKPTSITEKEINCPMLECPLGLNFTGAMDFSVSLNGIDWRDFKLGFYYYLQPEFSDLFPKSGPSRSKTSVHAFGNDFRSDFPGSNAACKAGNYYAKATVISKTEMACEFTNLPMLDSGKSLNFSIALNNYSFTEENANYTFSPYGIQRIRPSSGPAQGGTDIMIKGSGFIETDNARCRFGVPGYYAYTSAKFIDEATMICVSPSSFNIPIAGQLPFSVPFSIAFNEEEYNPWTESTHFFSFYENPSILSIDPKQGKTSVITQVDVWAPIEKPFSSPSASVVDEDIVDFSKSKSGVIVNKQSIDYEPIGCSFGRFGVTQGIYVNRTLIKCITPTIRDDSDIGYEEVEVGIALNGVDYVTNSDVVYLFEGPDSGSMLFVYILITLFTILIIICIIAIISKYWDNIMRQFESANAGRNVFAAGEPHIVEKIPRYINPNLRQDLIEGNFDPEAVSNN
jgi:hypothetical protein